MPTSKTKKFKVIHNPELLAAGKGFVPVYGSDEDLQIVNDLMDLEKKLELVDNKILRNGAPKEHTVKMKEILRQEAFLVSRIIKRNNDF